MDDENQLVDSAMKKWRRGEPLSLADAERILNLLATADLKIDVPDGATIAGIQTRMRGILSQKYLGGGK